MIFNGHLPQVLPPRQPQAQERDHRYQYYLSENLSGIKVTQIFGREDEKMEDFRQKSQKLARANQEQIFVFSVFRPLVYMLYVSSILCLFYLGGMGHLNNVSFLGQIHSSGTIVTFYMVHLQVLHSHPEPGRAVQLAAVGAGIGRKGVLHHGHPAQDAGCPRCH